MGILICGLNGAGKSTVGRTLAARMGYEFIDNEDLYFSKQDSKYEYSNPRSKEEAVHILEEKIKDNHNFVFAAVKGDFGENVVSLYNYVIVVEVPKDIRVYEISGPLFFGAADKIPEIIEKSCKQSEIEILSDEKYLEMIDKKLDEELTEYHKDKNLEELAGLLEVIYAATKARGYSIEELEKVRAEKAEKRGSFDKKILLRKVIEE